MSMKAKQTDPDPWWTVYEAAEHIRAHHATIRRAIWRGELRHARIGAKAIRVRRSWVDEWLCKCGEPVEVR